MGIENSNCPNNEVPPEISDEERATKKVRNKDVEMGSKNQGLSFRDTLLGIAENNEIEINNEVGNFTIEDADVKITQDDGVPALFFSDSAQKLMEDSMRNSVIVKLLGKRKTIGYRTLRTRIHALWKPLGEIKIVDLDNDFFIVKLNSHKDYLNAITGGPWVVLGHYLSVQPWSPSFNAVEKDVNCVVAWIRFPSMPIQYYNKSVLPAIDGVVGKFMRVDYNTGEAQCGKFARVVVEINLSKPLISQFTIDGRLRRVKYEDLPIICFQCDKYDHSKEGCKEICTDCPSMVGGSVKNPGYAHSDG